MFEFEIYSKNNKKMVYLSNDGSSGCRYPFKTKEDLKQIVSDYIDDNYDEDYNYSREYELIDLDILKRIAKDYGVSVDTITGLSLRDIEKELGEEEGALDRYLLDEEDE